MSTTDSAAACSRCGLPVQQTANGLQTTGPRPTEYCEATRGFHVTDPPAATARAEQPATPVIRIPLAGVPAECPHCGMAAAFPLTVFGNRVSASCPACHMIVAPVAVTHISDARTAQPQRAAVADLLGADPDWCGGQSVDEYMAEQRRDRYNTEGNNR